MFGHEIVVYFMWLGATMEYHELAAFRHDAAGPGLPILACFHVHATLAHLPAPALCQPIIKEPSFSGIEYAGEIVLITSVPAHEMREIFLPEQLVDVRELASVPVHDAAVDALPSRTP